MDDIMINMANQDETDRFMVKIAKKGDFVTACIYCTKSTFSIGKTLCFLGVKNE